MKKKRKHSNTFTLSKIAIVISSLIALPTYANAESSSGNIVDDESVERIMITGSRIRSVNALAPSQITSISAEDLALTGHINVMDALLDLPSVAGGLTTGNDNPQRDPTNWTTSGSMDGEAWTQLDIDSYPEDPERLITYHFNIDDADTAYKYYQFTFENNQEGDNIGGGSGRLIQIGELALLTKN